MEAVQIVQNPGTLVSGKNAASVTGLAGDATAPAIFEQMFARATSVAGIAEQASLEAGLPVSANQKVTLVDNATLPLTGQLPVLLPTGDADAAVSIGGETTEASATAKTSMASETGLELTQMLLRNFGKTLERKDSTQGKNVEKKGEFPTSQPEEEVKSVTSELVAPKKLEVAVESQDETGSTGNSISTDEKKSEGFSAEDVATIIPVVTPEFVATPMIAKESSSTISGEVFKVPERSAFAGAAVSIENGSETPIPVRREGITGSEPFGKDMDIVVSTDSDVLKDVPVQIMGKDEAARKPEQGVNSGREKQELLNAVKGETVLRQVPSGVTVANPAQTVLMGNSPFRAEMTTVFRKGSEGEEQTVRETDTGAATVSEGILSEADQVGILNNTSLSSGEGNVQQNAGEGTNNRQLFASISPSGSFETALQKQPETQPAVEKTVLHESILSQVREKLVSTEQVNGNGQITLKLNPRELGDLQIHLRMEDSKVSVEITAQNAVVREALVQNLDQLKETLSRQNIAMERFDVMTGNGQTSNQSFREGHQTAQPHFDDTYYPDTGYYPEESGKSTIAYGEVRENSLVDMRF